MGLLPELRFCLDLLLDELAHAQEQVKRATERLKGLAEADRHRKATAVLCSVPGVGVLTAAAFRLELPEPQRFDHDGQVARMAGLAPQVRQSGETRREGGLLKSGNARLRTVLVEAAWRWGMATIRDKMGHCLHDFFTMRRSREQVAILDAG